MTSATMTIRVPAEVRDKLSRLAQSTRRSRSYLAAEAVAAYVERELSIVEGIEQGLADVAAGRVTPHEEVMAEIHAIIDEAERKRAASR
jgi:predicted transcriptional regulator